jgi:lipid-A-disaccharide synthase-like uncharacterized protein
VLGLFTQLSGDLFNFLSSTFLFSLVINLVITLAGKFAMPFASEVAMLASREMTHGKFRNHFWWGGIALGHVIPLALFLVFNTISFPIAVICAIIGLFFYEYAFVLAPQHIPNS